MFPAMRPIKSPPSLFTINGFGLGMYGKRSFDAATGTYIKTRCLCALFIPIFPVDAYRVANAPNGGWYFLGKEKITGFTKGWRWCMIAVVAVTIASIVQSAHTRSPEFRTEKVREKALEQASSGHPLEAADIYRDGLREGLGNTAEWRKAMSTLVLSEITSGDPQRASRAIRYADQNKTVPGAREPLIPDLADRALEAASKCDDPADAGKILSSFRPEPKDLTRVHEELRKSLESQHTKQPDDQDVRIKLALIREEFGEVNGAIDLLAPAAAALGDGEGARLYGHLLLGENRAPEALPHLERYLDKRTSSWTGEGKNLQAAYESARTRELDRLNQTGGPQGFRASYDAAGDDEKQRMVEEYLAGKLTQDPSLLAAQDRYRKSASIVPDIMDLGVARLRVAQAEADGPRRKELLISAEQAFLSLKNVAGESDEFRLFLGQIYFWSGRETEGRALFEELLAAKQRDVATLYGLANIFRDLGEENDARKLLEEAFSKSVVPIEKESIISLRALLASTTDEKIEWLSKGDKSSPGLVISLAEARGRKAEETGDTELATRCYSQALAAYEKQERTSANLNNSALLHRAIYQIDGRPEDFEKAARLMSEAVELQPANSILSFNAADYLVNSAVLRLVADQVPPELVQYDMGLGTLQYLYQNEKGKAAIVSSLRSDPNFRKALGHFWNALLLSPKNTQLYAWGLGVFYFTSDEVSMERLLAKAAEQEFDFTGQKAELARYMNKERDSEMKTSINAQRERMNKLASDLTDKRSRAMARSQLASIRLTSYMIGEDPEVDQWIADLKQARKDAPSSRVRSGVESALQIAALDKLSKGDPACAEIIEADRRSLGSAQLLQLLVRAKGDLGERVRKHPAVIEAREAGFEVVELFPSSVGLDDWILVEGLRPDMDSRLNELVASNKAGALMNRLRLEIQNDAPSVLLESFWTKVYEGDDAGARDLLTRIREAGLKLPPLL